MHKQKTFKSTATDYSKFDGLVTIVRRLNRKEVDAEVGPMFKCVAQNGEVFDAFADELS